MRGIARVSEQDRPVYRELVAATVILPMHAFIDGPESAFRFTDAGSVASSCSLHRLADLKRSLADPQHQGWPRG